MPFVEGTGMTLDVAGQAATPIVLDMEAAQRGHRTSFRLLFFGWL